MWVYQSVKSHGVPCFAFQGDFPMFIHSRILLTCRRHRVRVRFEKTVCTFWICAHSVHTWYIPVYTMYIVLCRMFSHSPGQVSYFLAVGQCVDVWSCQHTYSMHSTAYPAAKSEKINSSYRNSHNTNTLLGKHLILGQACRIIGVALYGADIPLEDWGV